MRQISQYGLNCLRDADYGDPSYFFLWEDMEYPHWVNKSYTPSSMQSIAGVGYPPGTLVQDEPQQPILYGTTWGVPPAAKPHIVYQSKMIRLPREWANSYATPDNWSVISYPKSYEEQYPAFGFPCPNFPNYAIEKQLVIEAATGDYFLNFMVRSDMPRFLVFKIRVDQDVLDNPIPENKRRILYRDMPINWSRYRGPKSPNLSAPLPIGTAHITTYSTGNMYRSIVLPIQAIAPYKPLHFRTYPYFEADAINYDQNVVSITLKNLLLFPSVNPVPFKLGDYVYSNNNFAFGTVIHWEPKYGTGDQVGLLIGGTIYVNQTNKTFDQTLPSDRILAIPLGPSAADWTTNPASTSSTIPAGKFYIPPRERMFIPKVYVHYAAVGWSPLVDPYECYNPIPLHGSGAQPDALVVEIEKITCFPMYYYIERET